MSVGSQVWISLPVVLDECVGSQVWISWEAKSESARKPGLNWPAAVLHQGWVTVDASAVTEVEL